jgi:hypothetical protein
MSSQHVMLQMNALHGVQSTIRNINNQHRVKFIRAQDIANQAQLHAQTQLHETDIRIQQLMALVKS